MSHRYWCVAIALGIVLSASDGRSQEPPQPATIGEAESASDGRAASDDSEGDSAPEEQYASPLLPAIESVEAAIRDLIPVIDAEESHSERSRNQRDLDAQEAMALWAFWMFLAAALTVALTAVGVFLIYRTLTYTRDAATAARDTVKEARNATAAAVETVTITRDLGQRQLRAYVCIVDARVVGVPEAPEIVINWTNSGQTPAYDLFVRMRGFLTKFPHGRQFIVEDEGLVTSRIILAPGSSGHSGPKPISPITPEREKELRAGTQAEYVFGEINYKDTFGKPRITRFRFILGGDAGISYDYSLRPCAEGNEAD